MKRLIALVLVLAAASVTALTAIATDVNSDKDTVRITENILYGDKSAAEGIRVSFKAHNEGHLFWSTEYTVGDEPIYDTEFEFYTDGQTADTVTRYTGFSMRSGFTHGLNPSVDADKLTGLQRAYRELYDRTEKGETSKMTVYLEDYYDYYPLQLVFNIPGVNINGDLNSYVLDNSEILNGIKEIHGKVVAPFDEFFRIPVLPDHYAEISVTKGWDNTVSGTGCRFSKEGYDLYTTASVYTDDRCFFAINNRAYGGKTVDMSLVPGGYGIYAFSYGRSAGNNTGIYADTLSNVYPLEENTVVERMSLSPDKSKLLLFTSEDGSAYLSVINVGDMTEVQKFQIGDVFKDTIVERDDFIAIVCSDGIELFTVDEGGRYTHEFTAPLDGELVGAVTSMYYSGTYSMKLKDGKLAVAMGKFGDEDGTAMLCDFRILVLNGDGLLYLAEYASSLSVNPINAHYDFNCYPWEESPISLDWE